MWKYEIVNVLAKKYGFTSYLEICTPSTGRQFSMVDAAQLPKRHRLIYNAPARFDDGLECTFRTSAPSSYHLVKAILLAQKENAPYDIVFVDPFHTYVATLSDLIGAYCLVRPGGVIVVHDCNPQNPRIVKPKFKRGAWCGVTYQAFVDFVLPRRHLDWYTVDCDYGCGVIFKSACTDPLDVLELDWRAARFNEKESFRFFTMRRDELLRLISTDAFLAREGLVPAQTLKTSLQ